MYSRTVRISLAAATVLTFLALPAESHAIFHWLSRCCGNNATPTYGAAPLYGAAPTAAPVAADPCAPPQVSQTVNYVPQTCYRTQYVNVPVTTYRPVVSRDPCTGCPVTCCRPSTSYVRQAQLVPYTTYRRVLSNPCCAPTATSVTAGYAPTYRGAAGYPATSSCSSCGAAAAATYAPATTTPYYGGATRPTTSPSSGYSSSNNYSSSGGSNGTPTPAPPRGGTPTYQQEKPIPEIRVERPVDQPAKKASGSGNHNSGGNGSGANDSGTSDSGAASGTGAILSPRLFQPNDRTTSHPILRARRHQPVSYSEPTPEPSAPVTGAADDGGWRPSTR